MAAQLLVIGCGNMGAALAAGYARAHPDARIRAIDHDPARAQALLPDDVDIPVVRSPGELGDFQPDLVVLALKPQVLADALAELAVLCAPALVVSIAAGFNRQRLSSLLGGHRRVARAMPNLPVVAVAGASTLFAPDLSEADLALASQLFTAVGTVDILACEEEIDAATALSGSGPAYFFAFVEELARAGCVAGLAPTVAERLARQTCIGAAALLQRDQRSASALKAAVCSPKGTTEAGLAALLPSLSRAAADSVAAAHRRARELAA